MDTLIHLFAFNEKSNYTFCGKSNTLQELISIQGMPCVTSEGKVVIGSKIYLVIKLQGELWGWTRYSQIRICKQCYGLWKLSSKGKRERNNNTVRKVKIRNPLI